MSGRPPKGQRAVSDLEAARAATRELHEQVQQARDIARELREAMNDAATFVTGLRTDLRSVIDEEVAARVERLQGHFDAHGQQIRDQVADILARLAEVSRTVAVAQHQALGLPDREATVLAVAGNVTTAVASLVATEEYKREVAAIVARELRATGAAVKRRGGRGQVIVRVAEPGERLGAYIEGQYVEGSG